MLPSNAKSGRRLRAVAIVACALGLAISFAACGPSKLEPQKCDQLRGKAFSIVNEAANCKTDADCVLTNWPGCPHEANQDMIDRIKPIKSEYEQGGCETKKQDCQKTPELWCNQYVCEQKRDKIRTEQP
jgi:hypothetical protein